jgi:hypothetical protein
LGQDHIKTTELAVILFPVRSPRTVPMPTWDTIPRQWGPDLV